MKFASLKYVNNNNIGDEIQTLAAELHLPTVDVRLDRDSLAIQDKNDPHIMILNGWFCQTPKKAFPPAAFIDPIIISMHINRRVKDYFLSEKILAYFKKHEPIGCRDQESERMLSQKGISTYFSKCLTITFPIRTHTPLTKKIFLVDVPRRVVHLMPKCHTPREYVTHAANEYGDLKFDIAKKLLEKYKEEATLIVTSRLHCALPCVAMGIPVIFWANPNSSRLSVAKSVGLKIYNDKPVFNLNAKISGQLTNFPPTGYILKKLDLLFFNLKYRWFNISKVNWNPEVLNIEKQKKELTDQVQKALKRKQTLTSS